MYCTTCGIRLEEKWSYCPQCRTKRASINSKTPKEGKMTFQEFIAKFSKEHNISEEEARELAINVFMG